MKRTIVGLALLAITTVVTRTSATEATVPNDPPALAEIADVVTYPGSAPVDVVLLVDDVETPSGELEITIASSNYDLFSRAELLLSGTGSVRVLRIPSSDRTGSARITITVVDPQGGSFARSFLYRVQDEPSSISLRAISPQRLWQNGPTVQIPLPVTWTGPGAPTLSMVVIGPTNVTQRVLASIQPGGLTPPWLLFLTPPSASSGVWLVTITAQLRDLKATETFPVSVEPTVLKAQSSLNVLPTNGALAVGDLDRDGRMDMVIGAGSNLSVHLADAAGFQLALAVEAKAILQQLECLDFDGDGWIDVQGQTPRGFEMWRNVRRENGALALEPEALPPQPSPSELPSYRRYAWGDFDGTGSMQFMTASSLLKRRMGAWSVVETYSPFGPQFPVMPADADGDGDLDLLAKAPATRSLALWLNDGSGHFSTDGRSIGANLAAGTIVDLGWTDQNNDGFPEPWTVVSSAQSNPILIRFASLTDGWAEIQSIPSHTNSVSLWGDFDGDGYLDAMIPLASSGRLGTGQFSELSMFLGNGQTAPGYFFGPSLSAPHGPWALYPVPNGALGLTGPQLLVNQFARINIPPSAPAELQSFVDDRRVRLSWVRAWDIEQSGGLTYNLRVGTQPGADDVVSSMSLADGTRLVAQKGNCGGNLYRDLKRTGLPGSVLYWSVQAVDHSYAGGPFAAEQVITQLSPADAVTIRLTLRSQSRISSRPPYRVEGYISPPGAFVVQSSTSLSSPGWKDILQIQSALDGSFEANLPFDSTGPPERFYRARAIPSLDP